MSHSPFATGYMAAIRAELGCADDTPFSPEALALILRDCEEQLKGFAFVGIHDLAADVGRDFWKMRQAACAGPLYAPLTPYLNDAGQVCLREAA